LRRIAGVGVCALAARTGDEAGASDGADDDVDGEAASEVDETIAGGGRHGARAEAPARVDATEAGAGDGADATLRLGDDDDIADIDAPLAASSSLSPDQDPALLMPSTLLVLARDPASSAHSAVIDTTWCTSDGEPAACCDSGFSTSNHAGGSVGCCCCCCG
jgi:hypothetical protein